MMRLTILALSLAALVSAAPSYVETDALVPETTLLGVEDTISNLKDQFAELKAQASSGMEVTPGVKKTIDRMVTMVENEIEPAIK
jgi:ABC-type oligopeptide transport system substrate-binding subunit